MVELLLVCRNKNLEPYFASINNFMLHNCMFVFCIKVFVFYTIFFLIRNSQNKIKF
jgi:hypothetical protein